MIDPTSPSRRRSPFNGRKPLSIDPGNSAIIRKPSLAVDDLFPPEMCREKAHSVDLRSVVLVATVFLFCTSFLSLTSTGSLQITGVDKERSSDQLVAPLNITLEPRGNKNIGREFPVKSLRTETDPKSFIASGQKVNLATSTENDPKETVKEVEVSTRDQDNPHSHTVPESRVVSIQRKKPEELKLPTPIMVMGMMKAGTTSIYSYFKCGMDLNVTKLSHYECKPGLLTESINMACGKRLDSNIGAGRKPFDEMDQFHLYAELDANSGNGVILPQYKYLQEIYEAYPNATWILNIRDPIQWLNSIDRWQGLRQRFIWSNHKPDLPSQGKSKPGTKPSGEKDEDMIKFYHKQAQRVRDFVEGHPSIHLVEVRIDEPDAGPIMEEAFGISRECWGNKNANNGDALWKET